MNFGYSAIYASPDKNLPEEGIMSIEKPQKEGWLIQELDFDLLENIRIDGQVFNFKDTQKVSVKLEEEIEVKRVKI